MKATILCYHKVAPALQEGRRLNVDPSRLRSHIAFFHRRGYSFLRGSELSSSWPSRGVCFTFDDAFSCTLANAVPLFGEFGRAATFYAVTSLVGGSSTWEGELAAPLATWDLLSWARDAGHEIGSHTATHARLGDLEPGQQAAEIRSASEELVKRGFGLNSFCYPYGSLNVDAQLLVGECGHKVGMALGKRPASPSDPLLALPRIVVSYSDAIPKLLYKLYVRPWL